jgi:hypothetical protein
MGLFDQIINAIDSVDMQGNASQIDSNLNTMKQLSNGFGADPNLTQSALSIVGNHVRGALQQQRAQNGAESAQNIVNQYSGTESNSQAVNSLFSSSQVEQIVAEVASKTGLNMGVVQQMLPMLIPVVLNMLRSGTQAQNPQGGANPVLNAFLDADRDGDVDIADAMQMASRHLGK